MLFDDRNSIAASCQTVVQGKSGIGSYQEIRLTTGLEHGFLYRPLVEWIEPALAWAEGLPTG